MGRQIFALYFCLAFGSPEKSLRSTTLVTCMNHSKASKEKKKRFLLRKKAKLLPFLGFFHFVCRTYFLISLDGNLTYRQSIGYF